ncbi:MAG: ribosomal protein [Dehalococcoidia bacterium]|nr:ribosomal protein [Dehalococcoidia bacterium]
MLPAFEGEQLTLERVLMVGDGDQVVIGHPTVEGARVVTEVVGEHKGEKIIVFKYKPKTRYRRKQGHRQKYTRLLVKSIEGLSQGQQPEDAPQPEEVAAPPRRRTRRRIDGPQEGS